jgi:MYXO-CTERM domain-containing protein
MLRTLAASLVLVATASSAQLARADSCSPARVMVLLDKSSSMQTGSIGGATKWSIAVDGLGQLLGNHQAKAEFGLMTFPQPSQCGPGALDVAPALNNKDAILAELTTPPPTSGNYTPIAQTLDAAAEQASLQSAPGTRNVVLITDGWQYCVPYDPSTRFDGTPAVQALNANNIKTWVVGFGAEVDAAALNKMAVAAGTAKAGCNPNGEDPAAPDNCYFQVDNSAELVAALNQIAGSLSGEVCDGVDNDCDGQVDEDLRRSCDSACGAGTETCVAGAWSGCTALAASPESCDGDDNDCDGEVDEDGSMCGSGEVCLAGECQPPNEETGEFGATQAGCACDTNGAGSPAALLPFVALGFIVIRRRRR